MRGNWVDIVFIEELKIPAIVGIHEWERAVRQDVVVSLEMQFDISMAAKSGDIGDALDYAAVSARVQEFISSEQFYLLETMAEQTAELVMSEFFVPWLRISVKKTQVLTNARAVGVMIERGNNIAGKHDA